MYILIMHNNDHQLTHVSLHATLDGAKSRARGVTQPTAFVMAEYYVTSEGDVMVIDTEVENDYAQA